MKNILYYILIYLILSFPTGVLNYFYYSTHFLLYIVSIVLLGALSYLIDTIKVKKLNSSKIVSIKRCFFPYKYSFYYLSIILNIIFAFIFTYITICLFQIEIYEHIVLFYFSFLIVLYVNAFPVFHVIISKASSTQHPYQSFYARISELRKMEL